MKGITNVASFNQASKLQLVGDSHACDSNKNQETAEHLPLLKHQYIFPPPWLQDKEHDTTHF